MPFPANQDSRNLTVAPNQIYRRWLNRDIRWVKCQQGVGICYICTRFWMVPGGMRYYRMFRWKRCTNNTVKNSDCSRPVVCITSVPIFWDWWSYGPIWILTGSPVISPPLKTAPKISTAACLNVETLRGRICCKWLKNLDFTWHQSMISNGTYNANRKILCRMYLFQNLSHLKAHKK